MKAFILAALGLMLYATPHPHTHLLCVAISFALFYVAGLATGR